MSFETMQRQFVSRSLRINVGYDLHNQVTLYNCFETEFLFYIDHILYIDHLHYVSGWSQDWQMLFNLEKCSVMHMGKRNQELSYEMGGKVLKVSEEERYLGV